MGRLVAMTLAGLGAIALVWLVVSRSYVASISSASPEAALSLHPGASTALESLVEQDLTAIKAGFVLPAGTRTPPVPAKAEPVKRGGVSDLAATLKRVEARATALLEADPLSARPLRMLAEAAFYGGDLERATKLMEAAARRSLRETIAVYHWMHNSLQTGKHGDAVHAADIIIRSRPDLAPIGYGVLARLVETPDALPAVTHRVIQNPPWRKDWLGSITNHITDARTPLKILVALKEAGRPPAGQELTSYLNFLVGRGFYEVAHYAWLQFLTPEQLSQAGFLFNGHFKHAPSGSPLDWILRNGAGADISILPHGADADDRGLRVELGPGRVRFGEAMQSLVLPPGDYMLSGQIKGELNGRRGLRWRLACAESPTVTLAETQMLIGTQKDWRRFEVPFSIPSTGCRSQILRLVHDARFAAEQFVTGVVWYDRLAIGRR